MESAAPVKPRWSFRLWIFRQSLFQRLFRRELAMVAQAGAKSFQKALCDEFEARAKVDAALGGGADALDARSRAAGHDAEEGRRVKRFQKSYSAPS